MDLEVPDNHAALFRTMCGLKENAELPDKLAAKYWEMKRICQRDNHAVDHIHLHFICFSLGYGKETQREANPNIVDLFRLGKVKREARVVVQWGKGERDGTLKRIEADDRVVILMDNETSSQVFPADKVRVAEMAAA